MTYAETYNALKLPPLALKVALGEISLNPGATAPFVSDGFPPALIPLWSDDFGYHGFWKHWFCDRSLSIVYLDRGDHMLATEVARDFDQFVILTVLQRLCSGNISEADALNTLLKFGLDRDDFNSMMVIANETGDLPSGLLTHPRFCTNPPLDCFDDPTAYPGDFPLPDGRSLQTTRNVCGFELVVPTLQDLQAKHGQPIWLTQPEGHSNQSATFDALLEAKDFLGAWMSLNTPAWTDPISRAAIGRLASAAGGVAFSSLVQAWLSERQGVLA